MQYITYRLYHRHLRGEAHSYITYVSYIYSIFIYLYLFSINKKNSLEI